MSYSLLLIIVEVVLVTYVYHVLVFRVMRRWLDRSFTKEFMFDQFDYVSKNGADAGEEFKYGLLLTFHHLLGGLMMLLGTIFKSPTLFAQGVIFEVVDDVHDSITLIRGAWPFNSSESGNKLAKLMLPHHIFGFILGPQLLMKGLHHNYYVQVIGSALLTAGGIGLAVLSLQRVLVRTKPIHAWWDLMLKGANGAVFTFCRFYIFPLYMYKLMFVQDKYNLTPFWPTLNGPEKLAFSVATLGMIFFNLVAFQLLISGMIKSWENCNSLLPFEKAIPEMLQSLNIPNLMDLVYQMDSIDKVKEILQLRGRAVTQTAEMFEKQLEKDVVFDLQMVFNDFQNVADEALELAKFYVGNTADYFGAANELSYDKILDRLAEFKDKWVEDSKQYIGISDVK